MRLKSGLIVMFAVVICSASLFAAQVQETEDIDKFIGNDEVEKTSESRESTVKPDQRIPHKIFSIGLGFNFGIFVGDDIDDVNRHIYEKIHSDDSWAVISQSDSNIYLNLVPRLTINVMPVRYFLIQLVGEVGWGPKIVMSLGSDTYDFHFMRYTPGIVLNGYIPIGATGTYSFFLGGGAFYHFFSFESYKAQGFGGRGQLGLRIDWKSLGLEIFAAYDYARANTGKYDSYIEHKMVLDYSSVLIGINLYIKII